MYMINSNASPYSGITVMLTVEGQLALAASALAGAKKTRNEQRRKRLCEQAMNYLRSVVKA
jgi:hypothetical protein